tara:strand:+ start:4949 stop:5797 length:849 start_codon:yes stop_codon:yes gene_type:complete
MGNALTVNNLYKPIYHQSNMKTITIISDCDNTLIPDATSSLLEINGIEPQPFWDNIAQTVRQGWDPPIAWMNELISLIKQGKIIQDTNKKLVEFGAGLETFPGADTFVTKLNEKFEAEFDVKIKGYVVSSGIEPLMQGTKLSDSFTDIFGGRFYEKDGTIEGIQSCITFTEKTKFLYAINKGVESNIRNEPYDVNKFVPKNERPVQVQNMIYLGDGPSDIPCFSMVEQLGGTGIAVNHNDKWTKKWQKELRNRNMQSFEPNYTSNSKLFQHIEKTLKRLTGN